MLTLRTVRPTRGAGVAPATTVISSRGRLTRSSCQPMAAAGPESHGWRPAKASSGAFSSAWSLSGARASAYTPRWSRRRSPRLTSPPISRAVKPRANRPSLVMTPWFCRMERASRTSRCHRGKGLVPTGCKTLPGGGAGGSPSPAGSRLITTLLSLAAARPHGNPLPVPIPAHSRVGGEHGRGAQRSGRSTATRQRQRLRG